MHNIQSTLSNSLNDLLRMRDSYASAVVDCNYVVQLPGGFLRYTKDEGVSVRGLPMANSYTRERAEAVAAEASDGNGTRGAVAAIRDAISAEICRVQRMISELSDGYRGL